MWNLLQCRIWTAIVVALLGPFQYGIALTIVNTMLENLADDLKFDINVGGAVASAALYFGAGLGGIVAGPFESRFGKYSQMVIGMMFNVGSLLCAFATTRKLCWAGPFNGCVPDMIFAGRTLIGCASGLSLVVSPKYLAEVSPPSIRGALGACTQLCIAIGVFCGLLIGLPYSFDSFSVDYGWWRIMFLLGAVPALLQSTLMLFTFPLYKTTRAELRRSFKKNMQDINVNDTQVIEMPDLKVSQLSSVDEMTGETETKTAGDNTESILVFEKMLHRIAGMARSLSVLAEPQYRHSVILGIGVPVTSRLIGINVVGSYSTTIFKDAGFNQPVVASVLYGLGNVLASGISVLLFDRCGRSTMANISFTGMGVSYLSLALSHLAEKSIAGPLSVVFVIGFIISYGSGCGALGMSYPPEVVPPEVAGIVLGTGQSMSVTVGMILVLFFPAVFTAAGAFWSFLILFSFCVASLVFLRVFMVETKGRELEDIIQEVTNP